MPLNTRWITLPLLLTAGIAAAADWPGSAALELTRLDYQGSGLRDRLNQRKLDLGLQASPALGLTAGLGESRVDYRQGGVLEERTLALAAEGLSPDRDWAWRLGGIRVEDRQTGAPDLTSRTVLAGLGWWRTPDLLLDTGFCRTRLDSGTTVDQLTPMIGGSFNDRYTWVQLRGYLQRFSQTSENLDRAAAAELKLTQWLQPGPVLKPRTLQAMVSGGKRLYSVDTDTLELYTQPYIQTAAAWAGAGWRPQPNLDFLLLAGATRSHSPSLADTLDSRFLYLNLSTHW
ncbi:hypothetical protein EV700_0345 [Fluviicoccus keumensis]|uniref:DUF481 domain-containing protein n=1 Tax=Fluviicoccus keumensis TaxID=1435465 RepID=A0A4Q7ZB57_9GAMM|nr:hypothetical protein [Fluviicoccus keumensis]RZU47384.1 hypothetical protein EV700_0345 [Fluviicoccus keumensis]